MHEKYNEYNDQPVPCPLCGKVESIFFETLDNKTRLICREDKDGCGCSSKWLDEAGLEKIPMPCDGTVKGELDGIWRFRPFAQIYMVKGEILPKWDDCALIYMKNKDEEWVFYSETYEYKNGEWTGQMSELKLKDVMRLNGGTEFLWLPCNQIHEVRKRGIITDDEEVAIY